MTDETGWQPVLLSTHETDRLLFISQNNCVFQAKNLYIQNSKFLPFKFSRVI